ncbi:MAG TPA: response regulator, partial [Candidatus Binatia bacterium]|nr:response regulator [Candidatus Binatia bacterium]
MGQTVLSAFGYQVLTANGGPKALELIVDRRAAIDLVITDLVMPQMSGRELIEQIQLRLPGVPILCTSGFVRPGADAESEGYLPKPFTSQELLLRVKQLLEPIEGEAHP